MTIVGKEGLGVACLHWSTHVTNLQHQSAGGLLGITGNKKGRSQWLAEAGFLFTLLTPSAVQNIDNGTS